MPILLEASTRPPMKRESSKAPPPTPKDCDDMQQPCLQQTKEKNNNIVNVVAKPENADEKKRRNSLPPKRKGNTSNLLGQLNVDKKYLQDLLKCPGNHQLYHFTVLFSYLFINLNGFALDSEITFYLRVT